METPWGIITGILSLLGVGTAVPTTIALLLQRRNANKKLEIEEGGLSVSVFDAQTDAYRDLLDRSNQATKEALAELATYKNERQELKTKIAQQDEVLELTNSNLDKIRVLFQAVVKRSNIILTKEEQQVFDDTKPIAAVRRLRAQTGR